MYRNYVSESQHEKVAAVVKSAACPGAFSDSCDANDLTRY